MGFSKEWNERYTANTHLSVFPWSDLVSYVMRYARPHDGKQFKVLELGCGAGANIPFFIKYDIDYYAIEGSSVIVDKLKEEFGEFGKNIVVGDFTKEIPFDHQFDLIVDRASVTCNAGEDIRNSLSLVHKKLKPDGKFIGIDWYSTAHSEYKNGEEDGDPYTRSKFEDGPLAYTGRVHFSDKQHLMELFGGFIITTLEHKEVKREIPDESYVFAAWNLVAQKK